MEDETFAKLDKNEESMILNNDYVVTNTTPPISKA
jgi:hypothetical protein